MATTGPILTFGAITAGSGYAPGTYRNVPLTGGSGSGAFANITVGGGGGVTAVAFPNPSAHQTLDRLGKNYQVGDSLGALAAFDGVGSGTGFHVAVATLAQACENCFYGKIVPFTAPINGGLRFCAFEAFLNNQQAQLPQPPNINPWLSNITTDDYWCGEGIDVSSKQSFSTGVSGLPSTAFPGVTGSVTPDNGVAVFGFNLPGNFSKFYVSAANNNAATFERQHGVWIQPLDPGVSVQIASADGVAFSGAQTWYYLAMP